MKICKHKGCNRKHHAKNYCSQHYNKFILWPRKEKQICSIKDCNNKVGKNGYNKLCSKHYARKMRHGNPLKTTRFRKYFSLSEFIKNISKENIKNYEFKNHSQWSLACKIYYGDKCSICGWKETTCDVNHIIQKKNGGLHTLENGEVLCPNCHAIKHRNKPIEQRKYNTRV